MLACLYIHPLFLSWKEEDNADDPFHFEEISNSAATSSSVNNNNTITIKNTIDQGTASNRNTAATRSKRAIQPTPESSRRQFIFDSGGFCVSHVESGEDAGTKHSTKDSSTKASSNITTTNAASKKALGVKPDATDYDPNDIHLTFSI
jgi:hypothetical protein